MTTQCCIWAAVYGTLVFVERLATTGVYAEGPLAVDYCASTTLPVAVDILIIKVIVRGPA